MEIADAQREMRSAFLGGFVGQLVSGVLWLVSAGLAATLLSVAACGPGVPSGEIEVLETLPHDSMAYTQGLVLHDGVLYESTGRYGSSTVRRVDPGSGEVLARTPLGGEHFGEGLAVVEDRLVQLTWQEDVAFVYDLETLAPRDTVAVEGRGWGLCYDGDVLFSTSGGSIMTRRDPSSLEELGQVQIVRDGVPLWEVNELECVGDVIYANIFQSDDIVRIDKATGEVVAVFDAAGLVPGPLRGSAEAVLNGIAYDEASDTFYLTGKLWPVMYRVRLVAP